MSSKSSNTPRKSSAKASATPVAKSPLHVERVEEKEELAFLNTRLAYYIDYVRSLESEKATLSSQVEASLSTESIKLDDLKKVYEREISLLRKELDKLAQDQAESELARVNADDALKLINDKYATLNMDFLALEKKFDKVNKALQKETLRKTELDNQLLTLREKIDFQDRVHKEECQSLRQSSLNIERETKIKKENEFEARLCEELMNFRDDRDNELAECQAEIAAKFEAKLSNLQASADRDKKDLNRLKDENIKQRKIIDEHKQALSKKSAEVRSLEKNVDTLENLRSQEREEATDLQRHLHLEINQVQKELEDKMQEFQDLFDSKVKLDQEILMYRQLMETEEQRCNFPKMDNVKSSPLKRRRRTGSFSTGGFAEPRYYMESSTQVGSLALSEVEAGKSVKLQNTGSDDIAIGGWQFKYKSSGTEVIYKFHRTLQIKANSSSTIWSNDAGTLHNPPSDLVTKEKFGTGSLIEVVLLDSEGNEVARTSWKQVARPVLSARRTSRGAINRTDERCSLM